MPLLRWFGWALVAAVAISVALALIAWWETGPRDPWELLEGSAKFALFNLILFAVVGGVIAVLAAAYSKWVEQAGRQRLARWLQQWFFGSAVVMAAGTILHVAWRPITWWTDKYTMTGTALLVVARLGTAWATADYVWRSFKR